MQEPTEDTQKGEKLNVWMSPNLKQQIYRWGQSRGMNISEAVRYILRKETEGDNRSYQQRVSKETEKK